MYQLLVHSLRRDVAKNTRTPGFDLHVAAAQQNLTALRKALEHHGPNQTDEKGRTALHLAVLNGFKDGVKELCETEGIDVNIKDVEDRSALHYIVESATADGRSYIPNAIDMMQHLLDVTTIEVDIQDADQRTPLAWTFDLGWEEAVRMLLAHDADIGSKDKSGQLLFHKLVHKGDLRMVTFLLEQCSIDVKRTANLAAEYGETALHIAAKTNDFSMTMILLKSGCDPTTRRAPDGMTALHIAAENGSSEFIDALRPLHSGARIPDPSHHHLVIERLMEGNANLDTPLHLAAMNGHHETLRRIREAIKSWGGNVYSSPRVPNKQGKIPLQVAAEASQWGSIRCFLGGYWRFVDFYCEEAYGETFSQMVPKVEGLAKVNEILCWAVENGRRDLAKLVIKYGADVNGPHAEDKKVPLHYAASTGREDIARLLLDNGAFPNGIEFPLPPDVSLTQKTPLAEASSIEQVRGKRKEMMELLLAQKGIQPGLYPSEGGWASTPLGAALSTWEWKESAPFLLDKALEQGRTPEERRSFIMSPYQAGLLEFAYEKDYPSPVSRRFESRLEALLTKSIVENGFLLECVQGQGTFLHSICKDENACLREPIFQDHVLLNNIVNLDQVDEQGTTALGYAATSCSTDKVERLLDEGLIHRALISPIGLYKGHPVITELLERRLSREFDKGRNINCAKLLHRWLPYVLTPSEYDYMYVEEEVNYF